MRYGTRKRGEDRYLKDGTTLFVTPPYGYNARTSSSGVATAHVDGWARLSKARRVSIKLTGLAVSCQRCHEVRRRIEFPSSAVMCPLYCFQTLGLFKAFKH